MRERSARRVVPAKPVTVALENSSHPVAYGVVSNISSRGGCVLTTASFGVGEEIRLTLCFFQEPEHVETPGKVVWAGPGPQGTVRYGLKFDTTLDVQVRLRDLIDHVVDYASDA
jgi:Tfp pilus assembly protein PilZ